ncbi:hypothetical protein BD311DRAFT_759829 [Dichomitus squalens]|uniref:Translation initiation factor 3 N-terminal domain-containing protein n=1 Tax=Dichomitus squalens TaxID=114155 RepID=A0A4V2K063_9APHY|nr:hypothetical protein BD311DRAFT_759829 [Dichomitus squalens]
MNMRRCASALCTNARCRSSLIAPTARLGIRLNSTTSRETPPHLQGASQPSTSRPDQLPASDAPRSNNPLPSEEEGEKKKKPLQNPRNEAIRYRYVRLVNPETGALEPPTLLRNILPTLDRKTQYLELVNENPEPIVKIINTKMLYARGKAKKERQQQNRPPEEKELQLTWGVGMGDLQFKLRKAREDLLDGNRVTLIFAIKKGQKVPSPPEQQAMIEEAVRLLEDVGRERKERAVQKHMTALFLESLRPRKQTHELDWAYTGGEPWEGLKAVETALSKGARVEVTFHTPPPPKKAKDAQDVPVDIKAVEPAEVNRRLEETLAGLTKLGNEWKPRDTRKTAVIVYLEGIRTT